MTALSAAELQSRHELEGAPDPFPEFGRETSSKPSTPSAKVDVSSEEAFPTLAPSGTAPKAPAAAWGAGAGPRLKAVQSAPLFAESFTLASVDLSKLGKDGKPATLGAIVGQVMKAHKVKLESSTNLRHETTFALKAESQKELDKAKRTLLALLSPVITLTVNAPASMIPSIIGKSGANLKQIRDQTGVKIDIPRRDQLAPSATASGAATPAPTGDDEEEEEEPTVPITVTGPQSAAYEAQEMLNSQIASQQSATTRRVRDIPAHIFPFVKSRSPYFESVAQGGNVSLSFDQDAREVSVYGDRLSAIAVADAIKAMIAAASAEIQSLKLTLPKRQHRLLTQSTLHQILQKTRCSVTIPGPDDTSDEVTVWGKGVDVTNGLTEVMDRANSQYIHEFPLPGPAPVSKQLALYLNYIRFAEQLSSEHPGVLVFTPSEAVTKAASSTLSVELIGEKALVDAAVRKVSGLIGKLIGATRGLEIDWLSHRVLQGTKNAKKIKSFHEAHNVRVIFPSEDAEFSYVALVYDPASPTASPNPTEKAKHLDVVEGEFKKIAKEVADVASETISVEKKWHDAVIGENRTNLNALIGEEKTLSIKLGKDAGQSTEDIILVRGPRADVEKAVKEINAIVEDAKNDVILSSYFIKFDIDQEYVGRIVGAGGAGVNHLRETLGVKLDFDDDSEKASEGKSKKKGPSAKSHVTITGRKNNVEEAKKRILAQVERLADETQEILNIPAKYHPALIGQGGKYAIRLEEKYAVKITFPRSNDSGEGRTREPLQPNQVLIKGGRKGVGATRNELMDAYEFEKEANKEVKFTVPTRTVPRILGRAGSTINEIKESTGVQIDVEKGAGDKTEITLTGHKEDIDAAKAAILQISESVHEETTETLEIENKFHRTIIGPGGQGLRDLIAKAGGPTDSRAQAGLIRFPRQGEPGDEVRLRGEPKVVAKLKAELEKLAADLRDRTVIGVAVPAAQHRALIGRGGQNLNDLQNRTGAQVQFPGSRSYNSVGEPVNAADLTDTDPADIVKVSGSQAACEKAIEELKASIKTAKAPRAPRAPSAEEVSVVVNVPLKYHHVISQQGAFFRQLRSTGVNVENPVVPQKSAVPSRPPPSNGAPVARIDDESDDVTPDLQWQVILNYQDAEEGDSEWTLKSRDQAALERAQKRVEEAIENAAKMTHVGFLTMPDNSMFPRIVGTKGANVSRLRDETGADITLGKNDPTITIIGTESAIEHAKDEIIKTTSAPRGGRGRRGE